MRFSQVDVFSSEPLLGNPVAVVHDADGVSDGEMAAFARWTNLSETTFLLTPTQAGADYRLRIWTPGGELPFAGHPTLGSAHAWLEAGGAPAGDDIVQECGAGLVTIRRAAEDGRSRLAFAAPPLTRSGPVDADDVAGICRALRIDESEIVETTWIDNGPGWVGVLLADAAAVLAIDPDWAAFGDLKVGVVGPYADGPLAVEVRAFCPGYGMPEDPVTGSLNAGIGQWLAGGRLPTSYVASQGTALGRAGRVHVVLEGAPGTGVVWVGGDTRTTVTGSVDL
jgi:PhzF family phenazine biosynthesis protein